MQVEQTIGAASGRTGEYFRLFKDLTAEETKTVEQFRSSGDVSRRRRIVSDLIIYRSLLDNGSIAEYRDVREVDGEPVENRQERVLALFTKQASQKSVRDELKRISREGSRYDLDYTVSGLTVAQGLPLQPWARSFFDFAIAGRERIGDRTVLVVSYTQAVPNPRFGFDVSLPSEFRGVSPMYRGTLWIDAVTAHVWREVREVTVHPSGQQAPVTVQRMEFDYTASRFGVPLPKRIVFSSLMKFDRQASGALETRLQYRLTFEYGPFKQFTTSSDEGQIARVDTDNPTPTAVDESTPSTKDAALADESLGPEFGPDAPLGPPRTPERTVAPPVLPSPRTRSSSSMRPPRPILVLASLQPPRSGLSQSMLAPRQPTPPDIPAPPPPGDRRRWIPPS